jgi:hypothetical protein
MTVNPKTGVASLLSTLDLSAKNGLDFQAPAAFNFQAGSVTLMVSYGGSTDEQTEAACATYAVYTWDMQTAKLLYSADVQVTGVPQCVWQPVTQDFAHTF